MLMRIYSLKGGQHGRHHESIEKKKFAPFFIKERIAVYVYCYSYKGTRQLSKFGDVVYTSRKL